MDAGPLRAFVRRLNGGYDPALLEDAILIRDDFLEAAADHLRTAAVVAAAAAAAAPAPAPPPAAAVPAAAAAAAVVSPTAAAPPANAGQKRGRAAGGSGPGRPRAGAAAAGALPAGLPAGMTVETLRALEKALLQNAPPAATPGTSAAAAAAAAPAPAPAAGGGLFAPIDLTPLGTLFSPGTGGRGGGGRGRSDSTTAQAGGAAASAPSGGGGSGASSSPSPRPGERHFSLFHYNGLESRGHVPRLCPLRLVQARRSSSSSGNSNLLQLIHAISLFSPPSP